MSPLYTAALQGFLLGAGLIIAIGAQNAFILKQGLKREYVFALSTFCFLSDALLIIAGIAGMGTLVSSNPTFTKIAAIGGALFLIWFGFNSFRSAFKGESLSASKESSPKSLWKAVALVAALTWLNPHVYLDTVVMLGSIAGQYPADERIYFAGGAVFASMAWFYTLGYGAAWLAPIFAKPMSWKILDFSIGIVMWLIAYSLIATLI
ncbi:LysE/ArgO family amino acid transporter [Curvivirga aplysinae]|uniref:LysE/ArgO family amino acid transporter n=1 Tax=Curvivirga aplysinae TaxID=2529852 RepID=UPI0012BCD954|nr:LysE/ArgO family amino acid transporter [Curvivirga aplysinae]MTI11195.1 amino acid transporter [Curvivirga aplysinae]